MTLREILGTVVVGVKEDVFDGVEHGITLEEERESVQGEDDAFSEDEHYENSPDG